MDKNEFLGWKVRVTTKSKSVIEGVVTEVDDVDCRLSLTDALVSIGNKSRQVELVSVQGEDIVSLDVVSSGVVSPSTSASISASTGSNSNIVDPAIVRTSTRSDPALKKNPWAGDNVRDLKKTEFDFQANLQMFDKKKAFEELKGSLKPEDLLVTHNARPRSTASSSAGSIPTVTTSHSGTASLPVLKAHTRQPISKDKLFQTKKPNVELLEEPIVPPVRLVQKPNPMVADDLVEERREELAKVKLQENPKTLESLSVIGGLVSNIVPIVSEETMLLIEQKASKLTGPTTDQQLESAAREIMRVLLQEELTSTPSSVLVLVGNHREGATALAVGRSLLNRGISVTARFVGNLLAVNDHVAFQRKLFVSAGGKCVEGEVVEEAEEFDVVFDGVLGREGSLTRGNSFPLDSLKYSFLASIERSLSSKPDALFAIAFPKKHHAALQGTRLYLVDVNLPFAAFKSALPDYQPMAVFGNRLSVRIR